MNPIGEVAAGDENYWDNACLHLILCERPDCLCCQHIAAELAPPDDREPMVADGWDFVPWATQEEIRQALIDMDYEPEQAERMVKDVMAERARASS